MADRKYFCYLLTSLDPRCQNHTYVGFTVNPQRRLKQHNGELPRGAKRTTKKRPWYVLMRESGCQGAVVLLLYVAFAQQVFAWCSLFPHVCFLICCLLYYREMVVTVYGFPSKKLALKVQYKRTKKRVFKMSIV